MAAIPKRLNLQVTLELKDTSQHHHQKTHLTDCVEFARMVLEIFEVIVILS